MSGPMRVIARLASGIVTIDGLLHLDGILAYVAWRRHPERDSLPDPNLTDAPEDFALPLDRWEHGGEWGWCASSCEADWIAEDTRYISRPTPTAEMARFSAAPSVNVGAGGAKAMRVPHAVRVAREVRWYARGDLDAVRDMLRDVTHLGRLRHHGAGEIMGWDVAPWDADWSCVRAGSPMRFLPAGFPGVADDSPVARGGIRPPYWHPARQREVLRPRQAAR